MKYDLHIGIDYSGAESADDRLKGLQVYIAHGHNLPERITSPANPYGWNWTRREIAQWLIDLSKSGQRFIAGIDHAFSFPLAFFRRHNLVDWPSFLEGFIRHWPTYEGGKVEEKEQAMLEGWILGIC